MKFYRYVIDHDMGFSPNPFHGVCTLANCKPVIRRVATVGDFVLGFGSAASNIRYKMIFWMRVEEIMSFNEYWADERFQIKKPVINGSHLKYHGDNIYHHGEDGLLRQAHSFHSFPDGEPNHKNIKTDTGRTDRVLISNTFGYYGKHALLVPREFAEIVPVGRGHRTAIDPRLEYSMADWLLNHTKQGFVAEPSGWKEIPKWTK